MPAQSKSELQAVTEKEFQKLWRVIEGVEAEAATKKRDDDTSIKDVVGHRAHWIALFLGWYADGQAGKPVHFPAAGYKWNDLKRYNADLRGEQARLGWYEVKAMLTAEHAKLTDLIDRLTHDELYAAPMKGAKNAWTTGRWAEASGASHYRSATKYIRAALKADG